MVIYTTPCVQVEFFKEAEVILINWIKQPDNKEFTEAYLQVLQFATGPFPTTLFCTDLSKIGSLQTEQENWLNTEYYHQVYDRIESDIHTAVVFTDEHFKAIITNYKPTETEKLYSFIQFNYFTELKEAFHWLRSIKKGQDALA